MRTRIRKVGTDQRISTVAGDGAATFAGDGGPATVASIRFPWDVAATPDGGYLIVDQDNHRIRKVSSGGVISTVAGSGVQGLGGDDGPATAARRP